MSLDRIVELEDQRTRNRRGRWEPLAEGEDRAAVENALELVTRALDPSTADVPDWHRQVDETVAMGSAGLALFFGYMHQAFPGLGFDDRGQAWLFRRSQETDRFPGLLGGYTGAAWTIHHLDGRMFQSPDSEWASEVDHALVSELAEADRTVNWDLTKGLAGSGVYYLESLERPASRAGLEAFLSFAERVAEPAGDGWTWRYPTEAFFFEADRSTCPEGLFNLTVAHGTLGMMTVLAGMVAANIERERSRQLLEGAMEWFLMHELPPEAPAAFPSSYLPDDPNRGGHQPVRLAWCQGDAGVAASLLAIAQAVDRPEWEATALRIALRAAARDPETAGVADPCLCHGAAGLAHLFHRMYRRTGEGTLAVAARHWTRVTTETLRNELSDTGGAWSRQRRHQTHGDWIVRPEYGFLLGAAGVGLALLATISDVEPAWDRLLCASIASETVA